MRNPVTFLKTFIASSDSFRGQEPDEKVALLLRWHPYVIWTHLILFFIGFLLPLVVGKAISAQLAENGMFTVFLFATSIWYLFCWLAFFYSLTIYTLNVVVVTNKRIIYSEQKGLFNRMNSELHLSRVQDISTHSKGVVQTFFHFGELFIQTAGSEDKFQFPMIPDPENAKDVIMKMVNSERMGG